MDTYLESLLEAWQLNHLTDDDLAAALSAADNG
jgi:hypothetical protein